MLILLDIDGVMVRAKSWESPQALEDGFYDFDQRAVDALNAIIAGSNAKIILTTSHKYSFSIDQWINIFKNRGVNVSTIYRIDKNDDHKNRREEIANWFFTSSDVQDFVILDDDKSLNGLSPILKDRLILTSAMVGLTKNHVNDALNILATPLERV